MISCKIVCGSDRTPVKTIDEISNYRRALLTYKRQISGPTAHSGHVDVASVHGIEIMKRAMAMSRVRRVFTAGCSLGTVL